MPTSPMPNPRDYPDPIGYAVASADWWRARVHVSTTRKVFPAPTAQTLAFAVADAICGLAKIIMSSALDGIPIPAEPERNFGGKTTP